MINRIVIVTAILVFIASAGAALWIKGQMSTMQVAQQRKPGVLSLEIEADVRERAGPFEITPCANTRATAVLAIEACTAIGEASGPVTFASPSGEVSVSAVNGEGIIRVMATGAERRVVCPPPSAPQQPVWRFCVERKPQK